MRKRRALAMVLIVVVTISGAIIWYYGDWGIPPKPRQMVNSDVSPFHVTVAQGVTFQVNITLTSLLDTEISIPLENLLLRFSNYTLYDSAPQEKIFNYTFSPNPLTLAPTNSNSSILTVKLAEDAPIDNYTMSIAFGNSQLTHRTGDTFRLTITSS